MESKYSSCKYCGKDHLRWDNNEGKWRLKELDGITHVCGKYIETKTSIKLKYESMKLNKIKVREDKYTDEIIEF